MLKSDSLEAFIVALNCIIEDGREEKLVGEVKE